MLKVELIADQPSLVMVCDACEQPIEELSDAVVKFQHYGNAARLHHKICGEAGFIGHWPTFPLESAVRALVERQSVVR